MASENTLILLVGSNPLPNYLTACALKPSNILLVHTTETEKPKVRLEQQLHTVLPNTQFQSAWVEDSTSADAIRRKITEHATPTASLNYTGGTKVMAAHALMAYLEAKGPPKNASYLDEGGSKKQPRLRFDDGSSQELAAYQPTPLTLAALLALHGLSYKPRTPKDPAPTQQDAESILRAVLNNVGLAKTLYEQRKTLEQAKNPAKAAETPFRAQELSFDLSQPQIPTDPKMNKAAFEQWYKFLGGEWLEEWLYDLVHSLKLQPTPEIVVGLNAFRGEEKAQLEVDIIVLRGFRSYFISCTTDTTKNVCKSKLFEVAHRARQLGGDLARAALVCLADNDTSSKVSREMEDLWAASNTPKVFGIDELRGWSGFEGHSRDLQNLTDWLES